MIDIKRLVRLEPELERRTGDATASQCLAFARIYERWARQLRVKAAVMKLHSRAQPRQHLKRLPADKLARN